MPLITDLNRRRAVVRGHRQTRPHVTAILGDKACAEVFLLALDGLFADQPSMEVLEQRTQLLVARFAPSSSKKGARS